MNSKYLKFIPILFLGFVLQSCMVTPPQNPDNICLIFEEKKVGIKLQLGQKKDGRFHLMY